MMRKFHTSTAVVALGSIAVVFAVVFGGPLVLAFLGYIGIAIMRVKSRRFALA